MTDSFISNITSIESGDDVKWSSQGFLKGFIGRKFGVHMDNTRGNNYECQYQRLLQLRTLAMESMLILLYLICNKFYSH